MKKSLDNLKGEIESILFASAKIVDLAELRRVTKADDQEIRAAVIQLTEDYDKKDSSLTIADYEDAWKLTVKNSYMPIVEQVVSETELPKSILETLAVIAFRHPIVQSDVVKIRSNKAYDHLNALEELGFIKREKHGRTNRIHLTQKFFDYFELPPGKLKEAFASFNAVSRAIDEKEKELELMQQNVELIEKEQKKAKKDKKKVGILDVYDSPLSPDDFITYNDEEEFIEGDYPNKDSGASEGSESAFESGSDYDKELKDKGLIEGSRNRLNLRGRQNLTEMDSNKEDFDGHENDINSDKNATIEDNDSKKNKHFNINLYTTDDVDLSIIPHDRDAEKLISNRLSGGISTNKGAIKGDGNNKKNISLTNEIFDSSDSPQEEISEEDIIFEDDDESRESNPELDLFNKKVDEACDRILKGEEKKENTKKSELDKTYEDLERTKDSLNK